MIEERPPLAELSRQAGEGDFLHAVAEAVPQLLMRTDVKGLIGVGQHKRSPERLNWRDGHRERARHADRHDPCRGGRQHTGLGKHAGRENLRRCIEVELHAHSARFLLAHLAKAEARPGYGQSWGMRVRRRPVPR